MGNRNKVPFAWCFLLVVGSLAVPAKRWSQTGEIRIDTSDSSGAVLVGFSILITDKETGAVSSFIIDSSGPAVAPTLAPGRYQISAALNGSFRTPGTNPSSHRRTGCGSGFYPETCYGGPDR